MVDIQSPTADSDSLRLGEEKEKKKKKETGQKCNVCPHLLHRAAITTMVVMV